MLHLDSARRLSVDIDIVCPPGTEIEQYLNIYAEEYGFYKIQLVERSSVKNVPKSHAKYFYQVSYHTNSESGHILLDVLFEELHYSEVEQKPISSRFLKTEGDPVMVSVPGSDDLLGDKLTAFAPNTTGIPYFKGNRNCSMEIIKQLFDIASLFDIIKDLNVVSETFRKFATVELKYRGLESGNIQLVLDDILRTSLCICMQGNIDSENFRLLQDGIRRIQSFIHSEKYRIDTAMVNASKAAYLSALISTRQNEIRHFDHNELETLRNISLSGKLPSRLNKLKRINPEAFFYWHETGKLLEMPDLDLTK